MKKETESLVAELGVQVGKKLVACPAHATLINLTPHPVGLRGENGDVTVPPHGDVARVVSSPGNPVELDARGGAELPLR